MAEKIRIAAAEGGGIGHEIMKAARKLFAAAGGDDRAEVVPGGRGARDGAGAGAPRGGARRLPVCAWPG